jgi:hypothetical protein
MALSNGLIQCKDPGTKFMLTLLSAHNENFLLKKNQIIPTKKPNKKHPSFRKSTYTR